MLEKSVLTIQRFIRGHLLRMKRLPLVMYYIQKFLHENPPILLSSNPDGRVNSCLDEETIITMLELRFPKRLQYCKTRHWFDFMVYDYVYGFLPVNIKTSMMKNADNTGNLSICVQSYTPYCLDAKKNYKNGQLTTILMDCFMSKHYNRNMKKDYYFVVVNKNDPTDIIINSVKGLSVLTPNIHNMPFQVNWNKNRLFQYEPITKKIRIFQECILRTQEDWKYTLLNGMRNCIDK